MKTRRIVMGLISLIAIAVAGGLFFFTRPTQISGYTTSGAILSRDAAIDRAALSNERSKSDVQDVRLVFRKDFDELLGVHTDTYSPSGEFAAADSLIWVSVTRGNIGDSLPFFNTAKYDGVVLGLDAATGLMAGAASFSTSSEPDMKFLDNLTKLEDLDGKVEIVPIDVRSLMPQPDEEWLEELRRFEELKASGKIPVHVEEEIVK
ncbi:MAG: hypothetical protein KDD92_11925 [Caldilineaceae bacterium]|nr:hypothetical protein [Caldilineaceae bacterium]